MWMVVAAMGVRVDDVDVGALRLGLSGPVRASLRRAAACPALANQHATTGGLRRIPPACEWDAPVLWEFPGSGSTWLRRILEVSTGFATGSAMDGSRSALQFDHVCNRGMLGIAASSSHVFYEILRHHSGKAPWHGARPERPGTAVSSTEVIAAFQRKCSTWRCSRALIVDRDPYDAILSSYVSAYAPNFAAGAHELDVEHFEAAALRLAADYTSAWATYTTFVRHLPAGEEQTLIVNVDELRANCPTALARALAWLAPPVLPPSETEEEQRARDAADAERMLRACSLALERSPDDDRARGPRRDSVPSARNLTEVATRAWRRQTVCRVWSVIGHIARELGHRPTLGMRCVDRNELAIALSADAARSSPDGKTVVLATINLHYIDVFFNWALQLARFGHAQTMVVGALDWQAHDLLAELGAPVFPLIPRFASGEERRSENQHAFDGIWIERGALAGALLMAGYNVLLCDSDAVWTANVLGRMPALFTLDGAPIDAIASAGTFPKEAARTLGGHTAVMGFVLLRATPTMLQMFNVSQRKALIVGDDQVAFNMVLASGQVRAGGVTLPAAFTERARTATLVESKILPPHAAGQRGAGPSAFGAAHRPTVRLLIVSDQIVVRNCTGINEHEQLATSMVAHCLSDKNGGAKSEQLQAVGLWVCPIAWLTQLRQRLDVLAAASGARGLATQRGTARVAVASVPAFPVGGSAAFGAHLDALSESSALALTVVVTSTWLTGLSASWRGEPASVEEAWGALRSLARGLAAGLLANGLRAELVIMHWPQQDGEAAAEVHGEPWVDGTLAAALCVRVVRIPAALHSAALRLQAGKLPALDTVALNAGIRLARANHVLCASLNTRFTAGFFGALTRLRGHGLSHSAHVVSSCEIGNAPTLAALGAIEDVDAAAAAHCGGVAPSGAIGVLLPKSLWHIVRGMPEGIVSAPHADRYLAQRIGAHGISTSWLSCGGEGAACAISAGGRWTRWWRSGEATQGAIDSVSGARKMRRLPKLGKGMRSADLLGGGAAGGGVSGGVAEAGAAIPEVNLRLHANQLRAECEVALLAASRASGGFDATCDWGLVGHAMVDERRIEPVRLPGRADEVGRAPGAPIAAPSRWRVVAVRPTVPGFESDVDDSVNGGCWSTSRQLRAWRQAALLTHKSAPMLIAHVQGDLSQRQLVLASAWALAGRLGYTLVAVWERSAESGGSYDELFMRNASLLVLDSPPSGRAAGSWVDYVDGGRGGSAARRLVISRAHIASGSSLYVRTSRIVTAEGVLLSARELGQALVQLRPRASDIVALGSHVVKIARLHDTIGVHIQMRIPGAPPPRPSPRSARSQPAWRRLPPASPTDIVFTFLDNMTGAPQALASSMRFFLACDDDECYTSLRRFWRRRREVFSMRSYFPGAWEAECSVDEHSPRCQRIALFKMQVLLHLDRLVLSRPGAAADVLLLRRLASPIRRTVHPIWIYVNDAHLEDTTLGGSLTRGVLPRSVSHAQFLAARRAHPFFNRFAQPIMRRVVRAHTFRAAARFTLAANRQPR